MMAYNHVMEMGKVEVIVQSTTFHGGKVLWQICTENQCLLPQPGVHVIMKHFITPIHGQRE